MSDNPYADNYNPFQPPEESAGADEGFADAHVESVRRQHLSHEASVQSIGVLYLLGGIGVITLLYGLTGPDTRNGVTVMLTVTGIGLGSGLLYGVVGDLIYAQFKRQSAAVVSDAAATIDGPVLFHGPPTYFASMIERPDGLLGIDTRLTGKADPDLFTDALTNGYRIFTTEGIAQQLKKLDGFGMAPSPIELPGGRTIEIVAAE